MLGWCELEYFNIWSLEWHLNKDIFDWIPEILLSPGRNPSSAPFLACCVWRLCLWLRARWALQRGANERGRRGCQRARAQVKLALATVKGWPQISLSNNKDITGKRLETPPSDARRRERKPSLPPPDTAGPAAYLPRPRWQSRETPEESQSHIDFRQKSTSVKLSLIITSALLFHNKVWMTESRWIWGCMWTSFYDYCNTLYW